MFMYTYTYLRMFIYTYPETLLLTHKHRGKGVLEPSGSVCCKNKGSNMQGAS